ncbi:hypothetical protein K2173_028025 [Erythroxylum novogranatense]|uniref:Succinate dehydrogenase subunit 5, mitochondrial n=1 Tax=Erythroxylum novogranatense TaxID=1862640 RepID=A0AAV8U4M0_9ROSI|nr:hypothetical protein K2173_028025 [Erythroxylum novogranatense]
MEKVIVGLRSIYRAGFSRSSHFAAAIAHQHQHHHHHRLTSRSLFSSSSVATLPRCLPSAFGSPLAMGVGSTRSFSADVSHMPDINDPEVLLAFKDLMAESWDELPNSVIHDVKNALSKNTDDKAGQEVLKNVFRAAEAVEEFSGMVISLKMELDDSIGSFGEDVKPLPDEYANALHTVFQRYNDYLGAFGPDESYLQKKIETELGSKLIYLKMRCSGLDAQWGKVTLLGTSGLAGSYIEQRA